MNLHLTGPQSNIDPKIASIRAKADAKLRAQLGSHYPIDQTGAVSLQGGATFVRFLVETADKAGRAGIRTEMQQALFDHANGGLDLETLAALSGPFPAPVAAFVDRLISDFAR